MELVKDNCPYCDEEFSIEVEKQILVTCLTCRGRFFVLPDSLPLEVLGKLLLSAKRDHGEYLSAVRRGWPVNEQALALSRERVKHLIEEIKG